ncbi:hypothetical protein T06_1812 [Trichinella sp. T6]|nr:hypothetical protein T06_1812 [Trichinella sp. T6]
MEVPQAKALKIMITNTVLMHDERKAEKSIYKKYCSLIRGQPQNKPGVSLLETGTKGSLFQYYKQKWMTDERLSLWNVHNVNIRTNNHLEGWHNQLNKKAGGNKLGFNKLFIPTPDRRAECNGNFNQSAAIKKPCR